jgi:hypothetical protein
VVTPWYIKILFPDIFLALMPPKNDPAICSLATRFTFEKILAATGNLI